MLEQTILRNWRKDATYQNTAQSLDEGRNPLVRLAG